MTMNELDVSRLPEGVSFADQDSLETDLAFLLFPVHAFDAPNPICEWMDAMRNLKTRYPYLYSLAVRKSPFGKNDAVFHE